MVRIQCFHSSGPDSIPGQGTEISQASQYSHKKVKDNHSTYILVPLGGQSFQYIGKVKSTGLTIKVRSTPNIHLLCDPGQMTKPL